MSDSRYLQHDFQEPKKVELSQELSPRFSEPFTSGSESENEDSDNEEFPTLKTKSLRPETRWLFIFIPINYFYKYFWTFAIFCDLSKQKQSIRACIQPSETLECSFIVKNQYFSRSSSFSQRIVVKPANKSGNIDHSPNFLILKNYLKRLFVTV